MIHVGSTSCNAFARRREGTSAGYWCQTDHNKHSVGHAAARHYGQKGPSGSSVGPLRMNLAASQCTWPVLRSKPDSNPARHEPSMPLPRHQLLRPTLPLSAVEEIRWQILCCCVPSALVRVPFGKAIPTHPRGGSASRLQRAKRSGVPFRSLPAYPTTSSDCMRKPGSAQPPIAQRKLHLPT